LRDSSIPPFFQCWDLRAVYPHVHGPQSLHVLLWGKGNTLTLAQTIEGFWRDETLPVRKALNIVLAANEAKALIKQDANDNSGHFDTS
jgi:hypothetical protein